MFVLGSFKEFLSLCLYVYMSDLLRLYMCVYVYVSKKEKKKQKERELNGTIFHFEIHCPNFKLQ